MNKRLLFLLLIVQLLFYTNRLFPVPDYNQKEPLQTSFTLKNGLKVALVKKDSPGIINLVLAINVGSKDEDLDHSGYVHILEHLMLFGSTKNYFFKDLQNKMRECGIIYNAHTNQDFITFKCQVLPKNLADALEFFKEKVFYLKLINEEKEKEVKIIQDEINFIKDDPQKIGTTILLENIFPGHPYGKPIYGNRNTITQASLSQVKNFYQNFFVPKNTSLVILGAINFVNIRQLITGLFEEIEDKPSPKKSFPSPTPLKEPITKVLNMDISHGHLLIGYLAPDIYHHDQLAFNLLVQILGKGTNPLLYQALRRNRGLAVNINVRYFALAYGGVLLIHIKTEPRLLRTAAKTTISFLSRLDRVRFSKEDYLLRQQAGAPDLIQNAKILFERSYNQAIERGMNICQDKAINLLFEEMQSSSALIPYHEQFKKINSKTLRKISHKYFHNKKQVLVFIYPNKNEK